MKKLCLLAAIFVIGSVAGSTQTTDELVNDGRNPDNVTTQSMGYDRKSYSPLKQINRGNVRKLVPIWSSSLMNESGELAAPTVYNGVMYVINGKWTFAVDVETGRQIWRTPVEIDPEVKREPITRGAATIYNGKLFRVSIDNHVIALDMKTGKQVWKQKFADWREGYYATSAPIVANGVVISGMAGGESTTRGFLDGWDPDTGRKLWRRYTIPAPGEPGSETWPKNSDAWKVGGGPTWRSGSYDPQLDLVYWGVGNAEPYDPRPREQMDSLYTSSVLAIRPKTGEMACHYQYTPNDVYDVDGSRRERPGRHSGERPAAQGDDPAEQERLPVRGRSHQLQAHRGAPVRQGELGHARRSGDRASGAERRLQAVPRRRGSRDLARRAATTPCRSPSTRTPASSTRPRGTCRAFRSWRRPCRPPWSAAAPRVSCRGVPPTKPGDVLGLLRGDQPADGREEVGDPADRSAELGRHAGDRRRPRLHGQALGRVRGARRTRREDAVAVQDRLERQLDRDHLHAQGPAVRDDRVRTGRRPRQSLRVGQGADGRVGLDVRA